ncbi:MAG: hypothetical protein ACI4WY_05480 [Anaerovoracaceae bacterium]
MQGRKVISIVNKARLVAKETLEEIRFLNYRMDSMNPTGLILAGQNGLWDKLELQRYAAIRQRIDLKYEIPQHGWSQTEEYMKAHLSYAEGQPDISTDKTRWNISVFRRCS